MATNNRILVGGLLILLLGATRVDAQMAVYVGPVQGQTPGATTVNTTTALVATGSNRYLACIITTTGFDGDAAHVVAVTFAGANLHPKATLENSDSTMVHGEFWDLPLEGAVGGGASSTITASLDRSASAAIGCVLYTSVNQTTPYTAITTHASRGDSYSLTVTGATGQVVLMLLAIESNVTGAGYFTTNVDQTELVQAVSTVPTFWPIAIAARQDGASSITMSYFGWDGTTTAGASYAGFGLPLIYDGSGGTTPPSTRPGMTLLGVGDPR